MPAREIKHMGHTHNFKTVNEEILGIKIDDRDREKISEAFGWKDEDFYKVMNTMINYMRFQDAAERLNEGIMPESTKISTLVDFLKSIQFKSLGIQIKTPNDYFILGFIRSNALMKERMGLGASVSIGGGGLLDLLKVLAEREGESGR